MKQTVDWLEEINEGGAILIGDKETGERRNYYPAIIGITKDLGQVVYSREKLIECFITSQAWSYDVAEEWIGYNAERSLSYYGEHAPIIVESNYINSRNKKYTSLEIILDI